MTTVHGLIGQQSCKQKYKVGRQAVVVVLLLSPPQVSGQELPASSELKLASCHQRSSDQTSDINGHGHYY